MPACQRSHGAAENGTYGGPDAHAGDDEAQRRPPLARREYPRNGDARERRYSCPANALHDPPKDERDETRSPRAEEAPSGESEEPYYESAPDAEHVRSPPVERDAHGVGQQVAGDHPPDLRLRDTVVAPYYRDHDVDH